MKNCIRIPRLFIPRGDFEKWSVISAERFSHDRAYWDGVARAVHDAPSAFRMILPEVYAGEDDEAAFSEIRENMYLALEEDWMEKLQRGFILTERTVSDGIRYGIVAALDLEQYSAEPGVSAAVRPAQAFSLQRAQVYAAARKNAPLEFSHAVAFYRDKKCKIVRRILEEEPELLYEFDLMEGGGKIKGYFVPEPVSAWAADEMHVRGDPCFAVAEGNAAIAAAKAHWEALKPSLTEEERVWHPARLALTELINLCDDAVELYPVHRLVEGVDPETFCDFFRRSVKCRQEGNLLTPAASGAEAVAASDKAAATYIRQNGGTIRRILGSAELKRLAGQEGTVGILLPKFDKENLFPALKGGAILPESTFTVGRAREARYYLEGREISYD